MADGDDSLPHLVDRFLNCYGARAVIVGPHGSGKSTLLEHLVPLLGCVVWRQSAAAASGGDSAVAIVWLSLRRHERPFRQLVDSCQFWQRSGLLVIDGWEQLSTWQAIRVCWMTRRTGMGLLATCHRDYWLLPTLTKTAATPERVQQLVTERLVNAGCLSASEQRRFNELSLLTQLLQEEQGSVREVFMRLYDRFEDH